MSCGCDKGREKGAEINRRDFLRSGAAVATATLAPGVTLIAFGGSEAQARADAGKRWGLLIDVNRCDPDCDACVRACQTENGWKDDGNPSTDAQWIRKVTLKHKATGREVSMPVMCQHCEEPPCVDVCPTGASFKRADGIVLVDKHICIGCRYCMMACPFKARSFVHEPLVNQSENAPRGMGTVESCTLCVHRVDAGGTPACVEACAATGKGAIIFGDLKDPDSEISKRLADYPSVALRPDLELNPGVRYSNI
ncbi:sulfate reduction electron transfer complex DsrMKJOP subunit DsrO [Jhaorihella thermophila]|uniref:Prokaryotic molybdopterin-containing oxidoreductase family, iron-sulfur binding subunit n=1 Tax=Jhaorihella thermophila TaxID=488547 RepID=A0A1H5TH98_9RHOB|nr:4Fe-4S dicluster domain-containing protein [Jhaorihella thermophila]SEF62205.1 prokaryotic molybdopterin-containing oxidoreductase family, iron-sulfur binding subunit [Jhaorihella thermophila]